MKKCSLIIALLLPLSLFSENTIVADFVFWPDYALEGKAENYPGFKPVHPQPDVAILHTDTKPLLFHGEQPGERLSGIIDNTTLPNNAFSIELWVKYHVNNPVGALAAVREQEGNGEPFWAVGFYDDEIVFRMKSAVAEYTLNADMKYKKGFKKYWTQITATFDGTRMKLYKNGELVREETLNREVRRPEQAEFELAAYTRHEPHMRFANLVKAMRLHDYALPEEEIVQRYDELREMVTAGRLYTDRFHFTAGPYLNYVTGESINILWETDRPAKARIAFGKTDKLGEDKRIDLLRNKQEIQLDGLEPATRYFYRITSESESGETLDSGILTFFTAVDPEASFSFAAFGDTEARPQINDKVAKAVWEKRPNFVILMGDLSDGGREKQRFEWTHEYFVGVTQLASRIPFFPVPGNGEGDLVWYNHYHYLPEPEAYYTFTYGNADFFMLNSNEKEEEFAPGGKQYVWLEEQLAASDATWKFVAHHHAPYTSEQDDYGDSWEEKEIRWGDEEMRQIVPLYDKYDVDIVFYGHLHSYERSWPLRGDRIDENDGIVYIQSGGAGGNLADHAPTPSWFNAKKYRGFHFTLVNIHKSTLLFNMFDIDGKMQDSFEIQK